MDRARAAEPAGQPAPDVADHGDDSAAFRRDLIAEFGTDGIDAAIELFIAAERADFHWDGRIAEMNLGAWESLDDENEMFERVTILGYFRARYYVATCLVDGDRDVHWMLGLRH